MENLDEFLHSQPFFGLLLLISFVCILTLQMRNLFKVKRPSVLLSIAGILPLLISAIAALIHLSDTRKVLESRIPNIMHPEVGVYLTKEVLSAGIGLSLVLTAISIWTAVKRKPSS